MKLKNYYPFIAIVVTIFLFTFEFINSLIAFDYLDGFSFSSFMLVFAPFIALSFSIGALIYYSRKHSSINAQKYIYGAFGLYLFSIFVDLAVVMISVASVNPGAIFPARVIASMVLYLVSSVGFLVAYFLNDPKYNLQRTMFGILSNIILFVAIFISIVFSSSRVSLSEIITSFLEYFVISINICWTHLNYKNSRKSIDNAAEEIAIEEAVDILNNLKSLHDKGIISDEEYNEKKKKYIDRI